MTTRRISDSKRRHEANRYIRQLMVKLYDYADWVASVDVPTTSVDGNGTGRIYVPSQLAFEHLHPHSAPVGIVFQDGSFLAVKEIFRYDYASETDDEPQIVRSEFSYHYQSPRRRFFFRYDYHPQIGAPATHPLYHLHVGCWHIVDKFPSVPRFRVPEVTLEEILELIIRDFLTPQREDEGM